MFVGLRVPDAIHVATAQLVGVQSFWTTDTRLVRCSGVTVEIFPAV